MEKESNQNISISSSPDSLYMRRCIQLAQNGLLTARPNPMVGAVIVAGGRIIGEGYHVRCGEAHAEVNAFASVRPEDEQLLAESTIYVSLEPCAHYGKTPPCAHLIVSKGVRRVVVGCVDPFAKVSGRGIDIIRNAGIEVVVGVMEKECLALNRCFFTYHKKRRPFITLKWAQSSDGYLDDHGHAKAFSTPFTRMLVHKMRAENDAILVGRVTQEREHPRLDVRYWRGPAPKRYVLSHPTTLPDLMQQMYADGMQSLLVEGGGQTLNSFIDAGLWDEIRVEIAPCEVLQGTPAPALLAAAQVTDKMCVDGNEIVTFSNTEQSL